MDASTKIERGYAVFSAASGKYLGLPTDTLTAASRLEQCAKGERGCVYALLVEDPPKPIWDVVPLTFPLADADEIWENAVAVLVIADCDLPHRTKSNP